MSRMNFIQTFKAEHVRYMNIAEENLMMMTLVVQSAHFFS